MPLMPESDHSPPWSQGPRNIRYVRTTSAPRSRTYGSGVMTLPLDLLIFWRSAMIVPWLNSLQIRLVVLHQAKVAQGLVEEP